MKLSLRLSRSFVVDLNKWPAFCNRLNQESSAERLRLVTTPRHPNVTLFGVWNSGERKGILLATWSRLGERPEP